ncbi:hypothetical protein LEP48_17925 [Isoptericola sp. NEAU-Y5]|uniref:histidine kinase n=1 Tax=Isoptericola luteus TaxID=2879484 RepID=A0ABS7ZJM7_9MICO|nr:ATP-binding protein [Isoptericola sp. NEAU-Y5]MCA5895211.1 hypothetical protein [Isoptericola sp. NEAU-Y5]
MSSTNERRGAGALVVAWLSAVVALSCVVGLLLLDGDDVGRTGALAAGAVVLTLLAVAVLSRAGRRARSAWTEAAAERDELAAELARTRGALQAVTKDHESSQRVQVERRTAAETAIVALCRKVQASAHRIQEEAARMVQRHSADPDVLQTSMRIDHAAAQHARQAQSLVALCGHRPGQTWDDPLALPDVVRAAAGRITAFHRVEVSGDPGLSVVGRAVEPFVHLVAELLANATQCSPPSTQVLVVIRQVQRGAVVEIDDCGVGMAPRELERVREIASGARTMGFADLGEVPQTGLAVVGTYARLLGLRVDLTESVYGGLRAVVLVPGELTTASAGLRTLAPSVDDAWPQDPEMSGAAISGAATSGAGADGHQPAADGGVPEPLTETSSLPALPQRRSRRASTDGAGQGAAPARPEAAGASVGDEPESQPTAEEAGAWIGAFFSADHRSSQDDPDTQQTSAVTAADVTSEDT